MDIGRDLSYNENTARSGNLLKGKKPGRETMQRKENYKFIEKMRFIALLLTGLLLLSGCTKKEELLLLSGEPLVEEDNSRENGEEAAFLEDDSGEGLAETESVSVLPSEPELLCVHVCGAVKRPGVYELSVGCRVYEAVQAAGGFAADADRDYVNQAQTLSDGVKLVIPTKEEVAALSAVGDNNTEALAGIVEESFRDMETGESGQPTDGKININTATETELCNIPGIGATRAAAITAYRESHGSFKKPEDIMKVNGIKEGLYGKIKDSIRVD